VIMDHGWAWRGVMERAGQGPRNAQPAQDRDACVVPGKAAIAIAIMVCIASVALLFRDREQHRFRTNGSEGFAQPRHAVGGPAINRVEPRYDMDGAKRAGQGLGLAVCPLDRAADGPATSLS